MVQEFFTPPNVRTFSRLSPALAVRRSSPSVFIGNHGFTAFSDYQALQKPTTLIEPISISAGIAAAISVFFPPAAIIAGMGAMANGMLTQAGLNTPK